MALARLVPELLVMLKRYRTRSYMGYDGSPGHCSDLEKMDRLIAKCERLLPESPK